jgi:SAM-dependent methyltransferase
MTEKGIWEAFFDAHSLVYDENEFTKNTVAEIDFLLEELSVKQGAAILDVGCGTGRHAVELAKRGYVVTGIDVSAKMLAKAAEKVTAAGVNVNLIRGDATQFTLPPKYDGAICLCEGAFGLLGHRDDPLNQPLSILCNISRSLKPRAKAVFTVLNGAFMIRKFKNKDIAEGRFDPLTMVESSQCAPQEGLPPIAVRERAFMPTELVLLCRLAGMSVLNIWGGTAGNWGRRNIDLDEIELMIVARKTADPKP